MIFSNINKAFTLILTFTTISINLFSQKIMYDQNCIYYPDNITSSKFKNGYTKNNPRVPPKYRSISEERNFFGGEGFRYIKAIDLNILLNGNDEYVHIPTGSFIILEFKYGLKSFNDTFDLIVESCSNCSCGKQSIDSASVSISSNNRTFIPLGIIRSFETLGYDIERYNDKQPIRYVKIEGLSARSHPYGFELMKVYGFKYKPEILKDNTLGTPIKKF